MRLTIAYSKIKNQNLVLINNDTYQRETLSERPLWPPLKISMINFKKIYDVLIVYINIVICNLVVICT